MSRCLRQLHEVSFCPTAIPPAATCTSDSQPLNPNALCRPGRRCPSQENGPSAAQQNGHEPQAGKRGPANNLQQGPDALHRWLRSLLFQLLLLTAQVRSLTGLHPRCSPCVASAVPDALAGA